MQGPRLLDELAIRFNELLALSPARDFERNARAFFSASLARLDLVTREEFDVQAKVLARTREKLAALEARLETLERPVRPPG